MDDSISWWSERHPLFSVSDPHYACRSIYFALDQFEEGKKTTLRDTEDEKRLTLVKYRLAQYLQATNHSSQAIEVLETITDQHMRHDVAALWWLSKTRMAERK